MPVQNEYIDSPELQEAESSSKGKKKRAKAKKPKKAAKPKRRFTLAPLKAKLLAPLEDRRVSRSVGIAFTLGSLYLGLAITSYLLTWQEDQDMVLGKGFFEFLTSGGEEVANWFGRAGAWIGHWMVYGNFGVASLAIPFIMFLIGIRVLLGISILPVKKSTAIAAFSMVWVSMFIGFVARDNYAFLGGEFGFGISDWLVGSLGNFGAFLMIAGGFLVTLIGLFNPTLAFLDHFRHAKDTESEEATDERVTLEDIHVVNTITDDQIEEEQVSESVDLSDEEDLQEEDVPSPPFDLDEELSNSEEPPTQMEEEMEPVSTAIEEENDEDFAVEVAEDHDEVVEKVNQVVEQYGEYDPTLELSGYKLPELDLLVNHGDGKISVDKSELETNKNRIVETLSHYKIEISKIKATVGPTVTLYEIVPAPGVRISKIKNLEDDIALSLAALGIRIIAPIPGRGTIGIEVPNSKPDVVAMRSLIASQKFQNSDMELPVALGKTISNETFIADLTKMPHLLVAGATGQGKSVGLNAILVSILYKKHPAQVKFVLVDPKKVELTLFNKIERHFLAKLPDEEEPIITDTTKVVNTLNSLCIEMDDRYELLKDAQVRNIKEYNNKFINRKLNPENGHRFLPYIVVVVDEFADLIMTAGKEVEHPIARIAQLARAVGIHLIIATQRPSVNVITGTIKANFPARIAFRVMSKIDSRTILDASGADQLIGRGDMLLSTGNDLVRIQCGFVDTPEVEEICEFIGNQRAYPDALLLPEYVGENAEAKDVDLGDRDAMFEEAARVVVTHQQGSASLIQRKLKLGYNRAGRIVDQLEAAGIIGPFKGSKAREVLVQDEMHLEQLLKGE